MFNPTAHLLCAVGLKADSGPIMPKIKWAMKWGKRTCANNEDFDQPAFVCKGAVALLNYDVPTGMVFLEIH